MVSGFSLWLAQTLLRPTRSSDGLRTIAGSRAVSDRNKIADLCPLIEQTANKTACSNSLFELADLPDEFPFFIPHRFNLPNRPCGVPDSDGLFCSS